MGECCRVCAWKVVSWDRYVSQFHLGTSMFCCWSGAERYYIAYEVSLCSNISSQSIIWRMYLIFSPVMFVVLEMPFVRAHSPPRQLWKSYHLCCSMSCHRHIWRIWPLQQYYNCHRSVVVPCCGGCWAGEHDTRGRRWRGGRGSVPGQRPLVPVLPARHVSLRRQVHIHARWPLPDLRQARAHAWRRGAEQQAPRGESESLKGW
jgi:hypothetical protein